MILTWVEIFTLIYINKIGTARKAVPQTVDKVLHRSAGFFFVKCQKVQYLCGLSGTFLV